MAAKMQKKLLQTEVDRPTFCTKCGGVMVYKGIGEYECEECGTLEYDDYGKVRNYLEEHRGAHRSKSLDVAHYTSFLRLAYENLSCTKHKGN